MTMREGREGRRRKSDDANIGREGGGREVIQSEGGREGGDTNTRREGRMRQRKRDVRI